MYGCYGALLKLCCIVRQLSYCLFPSLLLFSLLLALLFLLLLLRLKVGLCVVPPLQVWVVPPSWIVYVGEGVVLPLIVVDKVCLLNGETFRLTFITFMSPPQKSQDELIRIDLTVASPSRFVITVSCAWITNSVSS